MTRRLLDEVRNLSLDGLRRELAEIEVHIRELEKIMSELKTMRAYETYLRALIQEREHEVGKR